MIYFPFFITIGGKNIPYHRNLPVIGIHVSGMGHPAGSIPPGQTIWSVPHVIGGLSGQFWAKAKVEKMAITNPTLMLLPVAWKLWKALLLVYLFYKYRLKVS